MAPCSGTTMIDILSFCMNMCVRRDVIHALCSGWSPLVGLNSGCHWGMCHVAGIFCLHGIFLDMSSSVPDLSAVSSTTVRLAEPLYLLSQEDLSQCQRRIASHAVQNGGGMQL